jgi:hypothetical protein
LFDLGCLAEDAIGQRFETKSAPVIGALIILREHESEHSRRYVLVAGIPGPIGAGLIVVINRPEEALTVEREARAVVLLYGSLSFVKTVNACTATMAVARTSTGDAFAAAVAFNIYFKGLITTIVVVVISKLKGYSEVADMCSAGWQGVGRAPPALTQAMESAMTHAESDPTVVSCEATAGARR